MKLSSYCVFFSCQMQAAGTPPRTPIAVLATTEESLRSSMTEAMLTEGGKNIRHMLNNCCHMTSFSFFIILPSLY